MLFSQSIGRLGRPQKNKFNPRVPMQAPQKPIGLDQVGSLCVHERSRIQEDKQGRAEALPAMVVWHGRATFKVLICLLSATPHPTPTPTPFTSSFVPL